MNNGYEINDIRSKVKFYCNFNFKLIYFRLRLSKSNESYNLISSSLLPLLNDDNLLFVDKFFKLIFFYNIFL